MRQLVTKVIATDKLVNLYHRQQRELQDKYAQMAILVATNTATHVATARATQPQRRNYNHKAAFIHQKLRSCSQRSNMPPSPPQHKRSSHPMVALHVPQHVSPFRSLIIIAEHLHCSRHKRMSPTSSLNSTTSWRNFGHSSRRWRVARKTPRRARPALRSSLSPSARTTTSCRCACGAGAVKPLCVWFPNKSSPATEVHTACMVVGAPACHGLPNCTLWALYVLGYPAV